MDKKYIVETWREKLKSFISDEGLKDKPKTSFAYPEKISDWEKTAHMHRQEALHHSESSYHFGDRENYEAEELHDRARKAHREAFNALEHGDKHHYPSLAKRANELSREANFHVKENIRESFDTSKTDDILKDTFSHIANTFKEHQKEKSSAPSAPDTSKFIATKYGHIAYLPNVSTHRGHGGMFVDHHKHFIQIGSNVDPAIHSAILSRVHSNLQKLGFKSVDYKGNTTDHLGNIHKDYIRIEHPNGSKYNLISVHGTAWGGIGLSKRND